MILDIDAGNTRIKWKVSGKEGDPVQGIVSHNTSSWSTMGDCQMAIRRIRAVNVAGPDVAQRLQTWADQTFGLRPEFAVSQSHTAGVTNGYREPAKLGVDRWLAIVAAWNLLGQACLVVDAGTTLTIDFIAAQGRHRGGYIVPGEQMMYRALLQGTSGVRFVREAGIKELPGTDTAAAVQNGCLAMSVALIERALRQWQQKQPGARVVFTGGGGEELAAHCQVDGCVVPDLVFDGLALALP